MLWIFVLVRLQMNHVVCCGHDCRVLPGTKVASLYWVVPIQARYRNYTFGKRRRNLTLLIRSWQMYLDHFANLHLNNGNEYRPTKSTSDTKQNI